MFNSSLFCSEASVSTGNFLQCFIRISTLLDFIHEFAHVNEFVSADFIVFVKSNCLEDLGKGLRSQVGTLYGTLAKGPRYLEMAEGYIKTIALDKNDDTFDTAVLTFKFYFSNHNFFSSLYYS